MIPTSGRPASSSSSQRLGNRRDQRQLVALRGVDRLEAEPDAGVVGRCGEPAQAVDDEPARLRLVAAAGRRR